jgi:16S rRNA (guanine527-N7)-methyltransferase
LRRDLPYSIPGTEHERRLVVLERTSQRPSAVAAPDDAGIGLETRPIQSESNPTLKLLRAALHGRGIRKHGRALLSGLRPVQEVLRDFPQRAVAWVTAGSTPAPPPAAPRHLLWLRVQPELFRELDAAGTGGPLLWLEVPALEPWIDEDWPDGCTLFVPFQDPENVGAVLRSAAAFGVARVVLLQEAAHPFHPRSARAAGSALLRVPMQQGPSITALVTQRAPILALSTTGRDVGGFAFPSRFGLLPGLEGPGLPESLRTPTALSIPMQPGTESLNAAAATAIALYVWSRGRS